MYNSTIPYYFHYFQNKVFFQKIVLGKQLQPANNETDLGDQQEYLFQPPTPYTVS